MSASREVQILFKGIDQATGVTKKVESGLTGIQKAAIGVGAAFGVATVAGVIGLTRAITDCIGAASEVEGVMVDLDAAISSLGLTGTTTKQQILDIANSLSTVTRFDDEAIASLETMLLRMGIGEDQMKRVTTATLDLASAMHMDLNSAAKMVAGALSGNEDAITSLRSAGVVFSDQQVTQYKAMVKAGKGAEAEAMVLKSLEERFGGAAKAAGGTFAGQLDILGNSFENLKEAVGGKLLDPLTKIVHQVVLFVQSQAAVDMANSIGDALGVMGQKALGAWQVLKDIVAVLSGTFQTPMGADLFGGEERATSFAQKVSDAITNDDWQPVIDAIGVKAGLVGQGLIDGITKSIVSLPTTIQTAADNALIAVQPGGEGVETWTDVGRAIGRLVRAGQIQPGAANLNPVVQWCIQANADIERFKDTIRKIGSNIAIEIWTGFGETNPSDASNFGAGLTVITNAFAEWANGIIDILNTIVQGVNAVASALGRGNVMSPIGKIPIHEVGGTGQHAGMAKGGAFVVPPGYPDDTFPAMFTSGEVVKVWPYNQVMGFAGGTGMGADLGGGGTNNWSPKYTPTYTDPGAGSLIGLAGLPGYQMLGSSIAHAIDDGVAEGLSQAAIYIAKWPPKLMHATGAGFKSVGVGWIDQIISGMGGAMAVPSEIQDNVEGTFKRWWTSLKTTFGNPGSGVRRQFQDWMSDWFSIATTVPGETVEQLVNRMLDTAIQTSGSGVAAIIQANRELFISLLGGIAEETVGGLYDQIEMVATLGGALGSLGSAAAERYRTTVIDPQQVRLQLLEGQLATMQDQRKEMTAANSTQAERDRLDASIAASNEAIAGQKNNIADAEQKILALQQQQADLAWLQAQMDLVKFITDNNLNMQQVLGGIQLGLGADPLAIMNAMTSAVGQVVTASQASMANLGLNMALYEIAGSGKRGTPGYVPPSSDYQAPSTGRGSPIYVEASINYQPVFSAVDQREAELKLKPLIQQVVNDAVAKAIH
jgi:hypothetical protein